MCLLCQVLKKPAYLPADLRRLPGVYHEGGEISELVIIRQPPAPLDGCLSW